MRALDPWEAVRATDMVNAADHPLRVLIPVPPRRVGEQAASVTGVVYRQEEVVLLLDDVKLLRSWVESADRSAGSERVLWVLDDAIKGARR